MSESANLLQKLRWSIPWLLRYPLWRTGQLVRRMSETNCPGHLIIIVANHFEPSWAESGELANISTQVRRLDEWCRKAKIIGNAVRDSDGTPFRHTNFYPAEQYHRALLDRLAALQAEGFGEVEIHLHHGVDQPDTAENLRQTLVEFRDLLAEEHECLSRHDEGGPPKYAFVHGNLALANSSGGRFCGVDSELEILERTGCYGDFTLPAAPNQSQVPRLNAIYQCGHPLDEKAAHRSGPGVRVGVYPRLPLIFTGPLVFNWKRRVHGIPVPRLDDGVLAANYPPDLNRLHRWRKAAIGVHGRPEWTFVKLSCHGFIPADQDITIGQPMREFLEEVIELGHRTGEFKVHFASAREAFNMVLAAVDGRAGSPSDYRDYKLTSIMSQAGVTRSQRSKVIDSSSDAQQAPT